MRSPSLFVWAVVLIVIGPVLQHGLAPYLALFGVRPDFLIVFTAMLALFLRPSSGAATGFFFGLAQGTLAGANLSQYVLTRALTGFACSFVRNSQIELGAPAAGLVAAAATAISQFLLMLVAPPPAIGPFIQATIGTAIYNGVIAMPLYVLLRRFAKPK
ncbi:MAG: rod shape-determining protein MreD [Armatimonadetes bacterium]|nr:rod shape-determining protein MreD [Armatimonadota bacterium]